MNDIFSLIFFTLYIFGSEGYMVKGKDPTTWSLLSAKFMHFVPLPLNTTSAEKEGWSAISTSCENKLNKGIRYVKNDNDMARILLFDINGKVAGIQMQFSNKVTIPKGMHGSTILENGNSYYLSAYFTNPKHICQQAPKRPDGIVGDSLFLQVDIDDYMNVPLLEQDLVKTDWVKGNCFFGMGQHYWYNINSNMKCQNFFPFFLLYNKGKLTGFGFAVSDYIKSGYLEYVPGGMCQSFFQKDIFPKCLLNQKIYSIQHIYLEEEPSRIRC